MTALQQTLYSCNRCTTTDTMPISSGPADARMRGPAGWMMFLTGIGATETPMHFCPKCAEEFMAFMGEKRDG